MKIFAITDVHSFYQPMMEALESRGFDLNNPDHYLVCCGDMFDRGPDAVKVFEFLQKVAKANKLFYVTGNHEELLWELTIDLYNKDPIAEHHVSNGTLDTICQITGISKFDFFAKVYDPKEVMQKMKPLLAFIQEYAEDYVEIGRYVFVHGWVPIGDEGWEDARWSNGMEVWNRGHMIPNKTIVCGHWHCSWGWSHLGDVREEFPTKDTEGWQASFEPFVDEGIVAFDACTAYTQFCNCVVFEV